VALTLAVAMEQFLECFIWRRDLAMETKLLELSYGFVS